MIVNLDGQKVRAMREERWLSREELATKADVGLTTLRNIECETTGVRLATARKLAKVLGVNPKSLARESGKGQAHTSEPVSTPA